MENRNEYIDFTKYIKRLFASRKFIVKCALIGAVVGLGIGFSLPKQYRASITLAPETEQKMGSGVSSIASMMGVSLDNSVDAISIEMFPDVVASTPFIFDLFDVPVTFERKDSVINTTLLEYMLDYQKRPWWNHVLSSPFKLLSWVLTIGKTEQQRLTIDQLDPQNLPYDERLVLNKLREKISVQVNKKNGMTKISLTMQDPLVVSTVVDAVKTNLAEYMTNYRTSKICQDIDNLTVIYEQRKLEYYAAQKEYAEYVDANINLVQQSAQVERQRLQQEMNLAYQVYSQVASQLETARIKELEAKPVFAVLEPVSIPIRKSAPSKLKLMVVYAFLATFGAMLWALCGKEFSEYIKENF